MANTVGPVLLITGIGYLLGRRGDLPLEGLGALVILVATPALIFSTLTSLEVSPAALGRMAAAAALAVGLAALVGLALLRLGGLPAQSFLPSLALPNSGNLGLPLAMLAFGEEGLKLGVAYFFVVSLIQHTVGFSLASGSLRVGFLLRQPLMWSVMAVLLVVLAGIKVPQVVLTTTRILGGMMIPAMLIMLGNALATLRVGDLGPALLVAGGRMSVGVASALAAVSLLGLEGIAAGVVFVMATMPSAIVTYVYAERFGRDAGQVAGVVVVSTLLTFVALPGLLWVALRLAGQG